MSRLRANLAPLARSGSSALGRYPLALLAPINLAILVYLSGTNRLATNDEARHISVGVSYWDGGDFLPGNDHPPLTRLASVLPLLPLDVVGARGSSGVPPSSSIADTRDQELEMAGEFLHLNPEPFNLVVLARMTGFGWWLLGGWIIARWSRELYGGPAGRLGLIFWSFSPLVLGYEQIATPDLPAAVTCLASAYAFHRHLARPGWSRALLAGFLLGAALLADYAALALLIVSIAGAACPAGCGDVPSPSCGPGRRVCLLASALGLAALVVNAGYGFDRSGRPLGEFRFASHALAGDRPPGPGAAMAPGNRFGQSWLARVRVPLPARYVEGIDRRCREGEGALPLPLDDDDGWPVQVGGHSAATGRDLSYSLGATLLASLLVAGRPWGARPPAEALIPWLSGLAFMALATREVNILPAGPGALRALPLAIVAASGIVAPRATVGRPLRWLALGLSIWCAIDFAADSYHRYFPADRVARFRQDLVRQGRKLGLSIPGPRLSTGSGPAERGLTFRAFTDSTGRRINYALFVPESYRGDRPFPLILFLHGWGDRKKSDRDQMYTEVGLPFTLKYRPINFLVLIPQGHTGTWDADGEDAQAALELLAAVQGQYRVDPKRIALTGLSSGGTAVWDLAARDPGRWAAIVPVAGSCDPGQADLVKQVPIWCFHNRYDHQIRARESSEMIAALRELGGNPRYTEYSDVNHNAGERAYILPGLYDWLARQRLP